MFVSFVAVLIISATGDEFAARTGINHPVVKFLVSTILSSAAIVAFWKMTRSFRTISHRKVSKAMSGPATAAQVATTTQKTTMTRISTARARTARAIRTYRHFRTTFLRQSYPRQPQHLMAIKQKAPHRAHRPPPMRQWPPQHRRLPRRSELQSVYAGGTTPRTKRAAPAVALRLRRKPPSNT
ncbi:Uncharacterised protein [Mycobacteroides abscessus subsp. abscessus]|nr:Uncharacterised protein [Mycobacteroides abscessus subsp. abscessus]